MTRRIRHDDHATRLGLRHALLFLSLGIAIGAALPDLFR